MRRTLLIKATAAPPKFGRAPDLEIRDVPCRALLSTSGRAVRVDLPEGTAVEPQRRRARYDAVAA